MCCIWSIIWFFQVRDSPTDHPRITKVERDYIVDNIEFDTSRRVKYVLLSKKTKEKLITW